MARYLLAAACLFAAYSLGEAVATARFVPIVSRAVVGCGK